MRKAPITESKGLTLAKQAGVVIGYNGKKETRYDLKSEKPAAADLKKLIIGRSGTLRAPCLRVGDTFVGGFNEDTWKKLLNV